MRAAGSGEDEIADFRYGVNRWRPMQFRHLVEEKAPALGFMIRHFEAWSGTVDPASPRHPAFARLLRDYLHDVLLMRGMSFVMVH